MIFTNSVVLQLAIVLMASGVSLIVSPTLAHPEASWMLGRYTYKVGRRLKSLHSPINAAAWVRGQALACALLLCMGPFTNGFIVLVAAVTMWLPYSRLRKQVERRVERIESQLDSFLVALTNGLRASPALGAALESVVPLCPAPLRVELDEAMKSFQLGTPLDVALTHTASRVGSRPLSTAVAALCIARRTGGDLPDTLDTTARALREMARLEGVVQSATASGRAQATAMSLLPLPLVALLHYVDSDFLRPLLHTYTGHAVIAVAVTLWLVGVMLARWVVMVDI